ncbi:hypothetical protein SCHPADRAFT_137827 [Schizopora paradoxa]|uniref:Uncharacterized protein n=1 Tax=Schizopora paradoxa TaxID=27342 RepID=A0A0H2S8W5_9AGAM|nr:hypothetical protein SCHPADRAFT_137827 [Schizopora paradoxa]
MPNIFSRRKGREEEPYVRPSLLQLTGSEESIGSDATAPNNPGPGRNVGVLFDAIGGKIERVVNEMAGRYRAGSNVTAEVALIEPDEGLELTRSDSIASDATAHNNPGPGRIVGLLFDAGGNKIEHYLRRAAGRYRLGPQAIFEDIQEGSHVLYRKEYNMDMSGIRVQLLPTDEEHVVLEKKCRKLLKYCRSPVLATQLVALEAVTTLAVEYPHIRQTFAGILHQSYLVPKYRERELHVGYCKTLVSVKETQIYDFAKRLENSSGRIKRNEIPEDDADFNLLLRQLNSYLQDSDVSFLLWRLMNFNFNLSPAVYRSFTSFVLTRPQSVEWDALRNVILHSTYNDWTPFFDGPHVIL